MKTIEVEYNPIPWFRWLKRKTTGQFPQNWGDVQSHHLIAIACMYKQSITEERLLSILSGIPGRIIRKLDSYHRYKLTELIEFVSEQRPVHELILKKLKAGHTLFIAPKPKLKGMPFGQFIFADTWFGIYQQSQKPEDLTRFVASLYWPAGVDFDEDLIAGHAALLIQAKPVELEAIVINWQLIHEWLSVSYPLVFLRAREIEQSEKKKEPNEQEQAGPDQNRWIKVFNNLVGDEVLERDRWAQTPVNTIFEYMTRKYKEMAKRTRRN